MKKHTLFLIFAIFIFRTSISASAQETESNETIENTAYFSFNETTPFLFLGKIDVNKANVGSAPIFYPGGNALGFFAAVMTHAVIEGSVVKAKESKEQKQANLILTDLMPFINQFNTPQNALIPKLEIKMGDSLTPFNFSNELPAKESSKWIMSTSPVFFVTQNYGSIILYNKIMLTENLHTATPTKKKSSSTTQKQKKLAQSNEKIVALISDPIADKDFKKFWSSNDGEKFNAALKLMYKESLILALENKLSTKSNEHTEQLTVKYLEDGEKKIERGYIIASSCKRTLFETLEGNIKSVPNLEFSNCGENS